MEEARVPSRVLNDSRFILNLGIADFAAGLGIFVVLSRILENTPYAMASFAGAILFWVGILPVRLGHRPHAVRDYLTMLVSRGRLK